MLKLPKVKTKSVHQKRQVMKHMTQIFALSLIILVFTACSSTETPNTPSNSDPKADYNSFSQTLPSWSSFSPIKASSNAAISTEDNPSVDFTELVNDTTYDCTTTPYSITQTPDEIVTFDPDSNILWVGSLLQGKGHKEGIGSLLELPIRERAPLTLSIDLLSGDNTRTVESPTIASVQQAIGELIETAANSGIEAGSSISFSQKDSYSAQQAALSLGLSANYMGFSASSSLEADRSAEEKTVTAYFVQKMFTVSMVLPQTPEAVFSDAFTQEVLDRQVALGNLGSDNIPTYVANIVYGRILSFSFTSTASESDIKATLSAAYEGVSGGGSADLSVSQKKVLQEAEIGVVTVGGEGKDALAIIRSGDLKSYFEEDASLTSAKPISYTVRNLGDNSIAKVSETTEYNIKECAARPQDQPQPESVTYEINLKTLKVEEDSNCDPGSEAELLYQFFINGEQVASKLDSPVALRYGQKLPLEGATRRITVPTNSTGKFTLAYNVWEHDGGSANDVIAKVTEVYTYPNITPGDYTSSKSGSGCKVSIDYTVRAR